MTIASPVLTLFSKPGCHLCDELRGWLEELRSTFDYVLREIDITQDADLYSRYRYDIPVLLRDGEEIGRGRIDVRDLERALGRRIR